jgi:hypothetical protein
MQGRLSTTARFKAERQAYHNVRLIERYGPTNHDWPIANVGPIQHRTRIANVATRNKVRLIAGACSNHPVELSTSDRDATTRTVRWSQLLWINVDAMGRTAR